MDINIFREYDIRGVVGPQLNESSVRTVARAIAVFYVRNGVDKVVIGYDARESSPIFSAILTDELNRSGLDVDHIGMVPTPVLYHTVYTRGYGGGVMITGSHNPPDHNGFKLCLGKSTLFGPQIQEIKEIAIEAETRPVASVSVDDGSAPGKMESLDVLGDYCSDIVSKIHLGSRKLKAVVDAGNGMGGVTAVPVYESLGVDLVRLFIDPDPDFPNHHPDPTVAENLEDTVRAVLENQADLGIAFDGDGDRIGIVDDTGRIIWGDELMVLLSRSVLAEKPGSTIIGEVKCSENLFNDIKANGGVPVMWKAGHSLIKAKMKETGAVLAGEMSGHIFFADRFYGFDDATYAGARLLEILSNTEKKLSELLSDIPRSFSTPELRVPCSDDLKFDVVARIAGEYSSTNDVVTIDGARISFENGWGLVRASNTQPILVLRFEADTEEHLASIRNEVEAKVDEAIAAITAEAGDQGKIPSSI